MNGLIAMMMANASAGGGVGAPAKMVLDGVDESIRLGALLSTGDGTITPAHTFMAAVSHGTEEFGVDAIVGAESSTEGIHAYFSNRVPVYGTIVKKGTTSTKARMQGSVTIPAGTEIFFAGTFDGQPHTSPVPAPPANSVGAPKVWINNVNVSDSAGSVGSVTYTPADTYALGQFDDGDFHGACSFRFIAFLLVDGDDYPTEMTAAYDAWAANDPDAFIAAVQSMDPSAKIWIVRTTDDGADGGSIANQGTGADATPINTEAEDLVAV